MLCQTWPTGSGIESVQLSQLASDRDRVFYLGVAWSASHNALPERCILLVIYFLPFSLTKRLFLWA